MQAYARFATGYREFQAGAVSHDVTKGRCDVDGAIVELVVVDHLSSAAERQQIAALRAQHILERPVAVDIDDAAHLIDAKAIHLSKAAPGKERRYRLRLNEPVSVGANPSLVEPTVRGSGCIHRHDNAVQIAGR